MKESIIDFRARNGKPPLIGYLPALYPDTDIYGELLDTSLSLGLNFMESGIPSLNPYLDGKIIGRALSQLMNKNGDPLHYLRLSGRMMASKKIKGIAMLYNETLDEAGPEETVEECEKSCFRAILVPNIVRNNMKKIYSLCRDRDLEVVNFVSWNHSDEEMERILDLTSGFIYMQSTEGKTGGQIENDSRLRSRLEELKKKAERRKIPVCLGFGINRPADAVLAEEIGAEGIIVGTSFLKAAMEGRKNLEKYITGFSSYLEDIKCVL